MAQQRPINYVGIWFYFEETWENRSRGILIDRKEGSDLSIQHPYSQCKQGTNSQLRTSSSRRYPARRETAVLFQMVVSDRASLSRWVVVPHSLQCPNFDKIKWRMRNSGKLSNWKVDAIRISGRKSIVLHVGDSHIQSVVLATCPCLGLCSILNRLTPPDAW